MKQKAAEEVGFTFTHVHLPETSTTDEILKSVKTLNLDPHVRGILVQLPLPPAVNDKKVTEAVLPEKDVDGYVSCSKIQP